MVKFVFARSCLDIDHYPLPKPDNRFDSWQTFFKTQAYQQRLLDDNTKQYVTMNTHQDLYQCHSAAIFQHAMDTILQGISGVVCYLDDILTTGKDEQEHLHMLEEVLWLKQHGSWVKRSKYALLQWLSRILRTESGRQGLPNYIGKSGDNTRCSSFNRFLILFGHHCINFIPNLAPIAYTYISRTFTQTEQNYAQLEKEASLVFGVTSTCMDVVLHFMLTTILGPYHHWKLYGCSIGHWFYLYIPTISDSNELRFMAHPWQCSIFNGSKFWPSCIGIAQMKSLAKNICGGQDDVVKLIFLANQWRTHHLLLHSTRGLGRQSFGKEFALNLLVRFTINHRGWHILRGYHHEVRRVTTSSMLDELSTDLPKHSSY